LTLRQEKKLKRPSIDERWLACGKDLPYQEALIRKVPSPVKEGRNKKEKWK